MQPLIYNFTQTMQNPPNTKFVCQHFTLNVNHKQTDSLIDTWLYLSIMAHIMEYLDKIQ